MRIFRCLASVAFIGLGLFGPVAAAVAQNDDQGGPQVSVINVDNSSFPALTLTLSVVDANGQPVRGLTPGSITVKEDQSDAEVVSVADVVDKQQGIAVVLAIDVSGSMAGAPIAAARTAAAAFVDGLGPNDQIAIVTFDRQVRQVLDFTASKDSAQAAIQKLAQTPGGATALYDGAKQAVLTAAGATLSRRMVILLSDGKEYISNGQNTSLSGRAEAYTEAENKGVTIHTIGLGSDIDEDYLRRLSGLTGGVYLAAPTPDELKAKWDEVATVMRQLVVVQVKSHLAGEGNRHDLAVSVKVGNQTLVAKSMFFSKAVAPQVSIVDLPAQPLQVQTAVTARVDTASSLLHVAFSIDGKGVSDVTSSPWQVTLDPLKLPAGPHRLEVLATDADGLTGTAASEFLVAALPPQIALKVTEGQLIDQPLSVTPDIITQGDVKQVTLVIDGQSQDLGAAPYRFVLDPAKLKSGVHKLTLTVTDGGGQTASKDVGFSVPVAPAAIAAPLVGSTASGSSPLLGVVVAAVIVLAGIVGFVVVRRSPARPAKPRGPHLKVLSGLEKGHTFSITPTQQTIGRLSSTPLHLSDPTGALRVSREHAKVWLEDGAAWIEDAGSHHGTFVDGSRIISRFRLTSGARIKIGEIELVAEGIAVATEDLRATTFAPLDKVPGADAAGGWSGHETVLSAQALSDADANRVTRQQNAEEAERQTRLPPPDTLPGAPAAGDSPASVDEANRATLIQTRSAVEAGERETRLRTAEADTSSAAPPNTDEGRQTKLKSG